VGDDDVLRIDPGLHAEAAAHVADAHLHVLALEPGQQRHQRVGDAGRHLARDVDEEASAVHPRAHAARLERRRGEPLVDEIECDAMRGPGERHLDRRRIAMPRLGGDVVGRTVSEARRVGRERGVHVDDGRQLLVVDGDGLGGVLGGFARRGDHRRHRLAGEADAVERQRPPLRTCRRPAAGMAEAGVERHRADAGRVQRRAGEDGHDARHRFGLARVHRQDPGVGVGRAQEGDHRFRFRGGRVVGEATLAEEERPVLDAGDGPAAAEPRRDGVRRTQDVALRPTTVPSHAPKPMRAAPSRCA
jgi:hypothetical protein